MSDKVECYAGASYPQRPLAVWVENERMQVIEVLHEFRAPDGKNYLVRVQGDRIFELHYLEWCDEWQVSRR